MRHVAHAGDTPAAKTGKRASANGGGGVPCKLPESDAEAPEILSNYYPGYQASWEVSRAQAGPAGILVDYTGGRIGDSFGAGTPTSRAQQFLAQIEPVLPGITGEFNGRAAVDYWPAYPWTRGSYSYYRRGQYTRFGGAEEQVSGLASSPASTRPRTTRATSKARSSAADAPRPRSSRH